MVKLSDERIKEIEERVDYGAARDWEHGHYECLIIREFLAERKTLKKENELLRDVVNEVGGITHKNSRLYEAYKIWQASEQDDGS